VSTPLSVPLDWSIDVSITDVSKDWTPTSSRVSIRDTPCEASSSERSSPSLASNI
jgi:hypothetical protein